MTPKLGYYSLIQYCPDASRLEACNLGVMLFCEELGFLKSAVTMDDSRARKFFGTVPDCLIFEAEEFARMRELPLRGIREALQKHIDTRANDIILTPLRSISVVDPDQQLLQLFDELVA